MHFIEVSKCIVSIYFLHLLCVLFQDSFLISQEFIEFSKYTECLIKVATAALYNEAIVSFVGHPV